MNARLSGISNATYEVGTVAAQSIGEPGTQLTMYLTILMQDYMGYSPLEVGLQRLIISALEGQ